MKDVIISASRRTDIPAFYSPWFINRLREGFCVYPNPFYPRKIYRVSLKKADVRGFVFWTRHAAPLIPYLHELDSQGFAYYFQYTIVGYPHSIEPHAPSLDTAIHAFCELSRKIGRHRVIWRYDPIVFNREIDAHWHRKNFRTIADRLEGATGRLVVSVIDPYARTRRRIGSQEDGVIYHPGDYEELLRWIADECASRSIPVQSCAEAALDIPGITRGSCIDAHLMYSIARMQPPADVRFHNQRKGCLCHHSIDIGVNDTCGFGCLYCYATLSHEKAMETMKQHQPRWNCISRDIPADEPEEGPHVT